MKLKPVKVPSIAEWRTAIGEPIEPEDGVQWRAHRPPSFHADSAVWAR
jgi:hypothetical protein